MSINRFKGRAGSLGFLAGDPIWLDGVFLGVEPQIEDGEKLMYGFKTDSGSEFWIDQDAFVALEIRRPKLEKLNS